MGARGDRARKPGVPPARADFRPPRRLQLIFHQPPNRLKIECYQRLSEAVRLAASDFAPGRARDRRDQAGSRPAGIPGKLAPRTHYHARFLFDLRPATSDRPCQLSRCPVRRTATGQRRKRQVTGISISFTICPVVLCVLRVCTPDAHARARSRLRGRVLFGRTGRTTGQTPQTLDAKGLFRARPSRTAMGQQDSRPRFSVLLPSLRVRDAKLDKVNC